MTLPRFVTALGLLALILGATIVAPAQQHASAQGASDLVVTATSNVTKAKIGTIVQFKVDVENTGTGTFTNLSISLGLPDALDARAEYCPFDSGSGGVTDCTIGSLGPGSSVEALFYVHIGSKSANGPATVFVSESGSTLVMTQIPKIKVVGSPKSA
jgi:uncharacterized repeat protein (TIGR01451 family)